jgi:HD superfamily phosphohydrolase
MIIKDPICGAVRFSPLERQLIDSLEMQRLRGVRQLAMAYLVYPGANHTRFEHSIGAMHFSSEFAKNLELSKEEAEKLRIAALLHDVGHIAFSHEAEIVTKKYIGTHEEIGKKLATDGALFELLSSTYSKTEISSFFGNEGHMQIISSDVGSDRIDYLLRDSHYTGVAYGVIDADRLLHTAGYSSNEFFLTEGGLEAAESLLVARFSMFSTVYNHHTVRIASAMLGKAIKAALEGKELQKEELLASTDSALLTKLESLPSSSSLAKMLTSRELYKAAAALPLSSFPSRIDFAKLEEEISASAGCDVILSIPQQYAHLPNIRIRQKDSLLPLSEVSDLVASLQRAQEKRTSVLVCARKKDVAKAAEAAKKIAPA